MRNEKWDKFFAENKGKWDKMRQDELNKAVQSKSKESDMNNTNRVVESVKEKVSDVISTGKQYATKPRLVGESLAKTLNGVHDRKEQVKDMFKLTYALLKEGVKEMREGYSDTRYKKPVLMKPVDKTNI